MIASISPYDLSSDDYKQCVLEVVREYGANPQNVDTVDSLWLLHGIESLKGAPGSAARVNPPVATPFTPENIAFVEAHARNVLSVHPEDQKAARKLRLVMTYRATQKREAERQKAL